MPDAKVLEFTSDGISPGRVLTYVDIDRYATAIGRYLRELGLAGHPVLVSLPTGPEFVTAFLGCIYAGAIPAPIPPCLSRKDRDNVLRVSMDAQAPAMIAASAEAMRSVLQSTDLKVIDLSMVDLDRDYGGFSDPADFSDIAYLQYTSGSTSSPRGVIIRHSNVLHNLEAIHSGFSFDEQSVSVSWLPHFHDMGLVYGVLAPICFGFRAVCFPSSTFAQAPVRWLAAITAHAATHSGAPDFAYRLCSSRITDEQLESLELGSWRVAFNGAETVQASTIEMFASRFATTGFRSSAFYPAYGLAEATLKVSGGPLSLLHVDSELLKRGQVRPLEPDAPRARTLPSCGQPDTGTEIKIVDPAGEQECGPGSVGEIWVSGSGVAAGYWRNQTATQATFRAQLPESNLYYLRTGDLGFLHSGKLFVTGRVKELIIVRGRNHYPQDIEESCRRADDRLSYAPAAAFGVLGDGDERVVVLLEWPRKLDKSEMPAIAAAVRRSVLEEHGISLSMVAFVKSSGLPKTTSGKIKRNMCRQMLLSRDIDTLWPRLPRNEAVREELFALDPLESSIADIVNTVAPGAQSTLDSSNTLTDLGLDSLSASQVSALVESRMGTHIRPEELLAGMSLADIARRVRLQKESPEPLSDAEVAEPGVAGRASTAQEALCLLQRIAPTSAAYHIARTFIWRGGLDCRILKRALAWVMECHPSLRTALVAEVTGGWRQLIVSDADVPISINEVTDDVNYLDALLQWESDQPFDLAIAPLFRVRVYLRPEDHPVVLMVFHHAIVDLWSLGIFMRDLRDAYTAIARTGSSPTRQAKYRAYVRFAEQQCAKWENGGDGEALAFWRDELAGAPYVLGLRAAKIRPAVQTYVGGSVPVELCPEIVDSVKRSSAAESTTPYVWLLSAFQVLLLRLGEDEEVVVGSPFMGRHTNAYANTIGYFTNPLPIRSGRIADHSFIDVVRQTKRRVLAAMKHSDLPFARIVQELKAGGDPSRHPIFQAAFVFHAPQRSEDDWVTNFAVQVSGGGLAWGEASLDVRPMEVRWTQFDITLALGVVGRAVRGSLEFNSSVLDRATAATIAECYAALLESVAANESVIVRSAPLLTVPERERVVSTWGRGQNFPVGGGLVHERFSRWGELTPEHDALIFGNSRVSYAELDRLSNRVAHFLQGRGVVAETRVGLFAERSTEFFAGLLGILKAGGVYVALNPDLPDARLRQTVGDAVPAVVLTQHSLAERASRVAAGHCVSLEGLVANRCDEAVRARIHPANAAYVLYTSGSTGKPKGVINTHEGLLNRLVWMQEQFGATSADRILHKTPISFDVSIWELLWPLVVGSTVLIAPRQAHHDPPMLVRCIVDHGVTILHFVPSVLRTFLSERNVSACTSLRLIVCSGETLSADLCDLALATIGAKLFNLYGPTEASIDVSYHRCSSGSDVVPIGRPVFNTQLYILDGNMELTPVGFSGEIYIGGVQLAHGYLNKPGLTAQRFVPNPFSAGGRLYRTGDLGRYKPDGSIEFLGRNDRQLKIHGCRVEPGEVETALRRCTGIHDAVVVARTLDGDIALVAYVIGKDFEESQVLAELRSQIPAYMCPTRLVTLTALPLNSSGKVDVTLLPEPTRVSPPTRNAPRNDLEAALSRLWSAVLGIEAPDIDHDFFALGGHSLQLMQLISKVRDELQVEAPLTELIEDLTIRRMAEVLGPIVNASKLPNEPNQTSSEQRVTIPEALEDSLEVPIGTEWRLVYSRQTRVAKIARSPQHYHAQQQVPDRRVTNLSSPFSDRSPNAKIECAGIVTANRPAALKTALRSCLEQFRRAERRAAIVVCDDSRSHSAAADVQAVGKESLRAGDASVLVVTRESRRQAVELLTAKAVAPRDVLEFALIGDGDHLPTTGASRNALQLAAGQNCFWTLDDDTEARFGLPAFSGGGSRFIANSHPVEVIPHASRKGVVEAAGFGDYCPLTAIEQSLGRQVCLPEDMLDAVREHELITLVSFPGIAGDCGWASPQTLLFADSSNLERLLSSEHSYELAVSTREYLQVAPCITVARAIERCMMTSAGMDNRSLLPPFLPLGRGQDTVFGQTVDAMKAGLCVHLPYVILHSPVEQRTFSASDMEKNVGALDISQVVGLCIVEASANVAKGTPRSEALQELGRRLMEIGALPIEDYREYMRIQVWRFASRQIAMLEHSVAAHRPRGGQWAAVAERYMNALRSTIPLPDVAAPAAYVRYLGPRGALAKGQQIVAMVGQLLFWWPAIVEAAHSTDVFKDV